ERGPVVGKALALDKCRETTGDPELPEGGNNGDRIGRGDHRPDDHAELEPEARRNLEHQGDDERRDHDTRGGEDDDPAERPAEVLEIETKGGLEDEARDQHEQYELRRHLDGAA